MAARIAPIHDNVEIVRQGIAALGRLGAELYARPAFPDGTGSIGSHYRHILDHYQAFFSGLESGRVDYDARERDPATETNIATARARAEATVRELTEISPDRLDRTIAVNTRTTSQVHQPPEWAPCTVRRELAFLLSHTVHHYALINLLARAGGIELHASFGVAPSTLVHRQLTT